MFDKYYGEHFDEICIPPFFEKREFGILLLNDKIWVRHKSFKNVDEINNFLSSTTPSDV